MDLSTGLLCIGAIYLWALFIDMFLKSCSHYAYIQFLKGTGLEIKIFQFKWTTTAFNRMLIKWGTFKPKLLSGWLNIGLCFSLLLLPIAMYILLHAFIQNFFSSGTANPIIEPVIPGIHLPASEMGYYSLTLLISSILHELGHALAAVQEDVNVINVGTNVFFILPVAFVNIGSDKLFSLNPWKQLKILCAGIWHNLVIALIAYVIYLSLGHCFSPLFIYGKGVVVTQMMTRSPLSGTKGLNVNDAIIKINDCVVTDEDSYLECLRALQMIKPSFCIEADLIHKLDESIPLKHLEDGGVNCCHSDNNGKLCFEYLDNEDNILELPQYVCLPGRNVIEHSRDYCTVTPHSCPKQSFCFRPLLANSSNLFKIKRIDRPDVIYIGASSDFVRTMTVSSYVPKFKFISTALPDVVTKFMKYLIVFSMGLAILNVLPCIFLDGQHIINTLAHLILAKHLRTTHIKLISGIITASFTFILFIHCIMNLNFCHFTNFGSFGC